MGKRTKYVTNDTHPIDLRQEDARLSVDRVANERGECVREHAGGVGFGQAVCYDKIDSLCEQMIATTI